MAAICTSWAAQQIQTSILSKPVPPASRLRADTHAGFRACFFFQEKKRKKTDSEYLALRWRGATPQNLPMSKLRTFSRRAAPEDGGSPPPAAVPRVRPKPPPPKRGRGGVGSGGGSLKSVFLLHWARERLEGAQASTSTGKRKTVGRLSRFPQDQLKKAGESTAPLYARSR